MSKSSIISRATELIVLDGAYKITNPLEVCKILESEYSLPATTAYRYMEDAATRLRRNLPRKPRKHNPAWKDTTSTERQHRRQARLDEIARAQGWETWRKFETAVLNALATIPPPMK